MTLTPATRLSPYEIVAKLGEGGPPSLAARFARSYGGSTRARERTWQ